MSDFIHINGQLLPYDSAAVAPSDAGLLHGAGLFETMRARNRKVFRVRQHLERITRSAQIQGIALALGETQLVEITQELLDANGLTDARLRLTITRGDLHAATVENPVPQVTLILSAAEFRPYPASLYEKGMTVIISRYKQNPENPLTGHKTTSYLDRLIALRDAQQAVNPEAGAGGGGGGGGAGEALWFTAGTNMLAEGSISNVFLVDAAGLLCTPPSTVPDKTNQRLCLPGITRRVVLELATAMNILPHERMLTIQDLLSAREVFLTNAIMGLMPVTHIEKHTVGNGAPGEMTRRLREAYGQALAAETS
jgi:branched-subunit amino acid aminotransferase/4-amino-4-deoxychorismate lyase